MQAVYITVRIQLNALGDVLPTLKMVASLRVPGDKDIQLIRGLLFGPIPAVLHVVLDHIYFSKHIDHDPIAPNKVICINTAAVTKGQRPVLHCRIEWTPGTVYDSYEDEKSGNEDGSGLLDKSDSKVVIEIHILLCLIKLLLNQFQSAVKGMV